MLVTTLVVSFLVCCRLEVRCGSAGVVSGQQAKAHIVTYVYVYIYIYMCVCLCVCIYIYIYFTKCAVSLYFQVVLVRKDHHASEVYKSYQHILLRLRFVHSESSVTYSHTRSSEIVSVILWLSVKRSR